MKKIIGFISCAATAALYLSACTAENLRNDNENVGKTVTVHFGTENTNPSTKATLTPTNEGETAFQAAWENGDVLSVYYINGKVVENDYQNGTVPATWKGSSFNAELPEYTGEWEYRAAYPVPDAKDSHVDFGPERTQKGNAYNSKYDVMVGTATAKNAAAGKDNSGEDIVFRMDRQTAIAYFHFTSDLDEAVTSATLTVSGEGAAIASNYAYVSNFAWAAAEDCQSITITFPEDAPNAQDFQLWFNVLPTIYESMTLTVETATKTFTISKSSIGEYVKGKLYKVKKSGIAWTDKGGSSNPATQVSVVNVDNVNVVLAMDNGSYGVYKDAVQTITVDGLEYSMTNICANSKNGQDGYLMAAKQFIQMKKSTSYIFNTKSGVTNIKAWVLPATTNAISIYQGSASDNISTLINNPNKTTETFELTSDTNSKVDTELDVYEYNITDGFFKLAPSATLWLYKLEVTYSNSGSSEPAPCETPVITLDGDKATITCATEGATIRYTLDRSDPVETSDEYTSAIILTEGQTIKAKAFLDGHKASDVASMTYSSSSEGTNYYTKVTSDEDIVDGGKYLIVYDGKAANGCTDDVYLTVTNITVENDRIESNTTIDSYAFTINSVEGGYTLKISDNYLGYNTSTKFSKSTTVPTSKQYYWTFTVQTNNSVLIKNVGTDTRFIGANSSTNFTQFRAYSTSNLTSYPQPTLYKLAN